MALANAALLLGCASPMDTGLEAEQAMLARSRQIWASASVERYRMTVRLHGAWVNGAAVIEVRDGSPVSMTVIEGAHGPQAFEQHDTVEELFLVVENALEQRADHLETLYHKSLGFPRFVDVDMGAQWADDEHGFTVAEFAVLP